MLVNVHTFNDPIGDMIARANGNTSQIVQVTKGIYEIGHFNFNMYFSNKKEEYPEDIEDCYGVCDNYEQILEKNPNIETDKDRFFVISITPIEKKDQSPDGGWRWHKWGTYIGKQKPTTEYIYDEPIIEKVYCYHIYEVLSL